MHCRNIVFFWGVLAFLVLLVAEIGSFCTMSLIQREWYSLHDLRLSREKRYVEESLLAEEAWNSPGAQFLDAGVSLHPYLGYSSTTEPGAGIDSEDRRLDRYGFLPVAGEIVTAPAPDTVAIGILGGSVAENVVINRHAIASLLETLKSDERFAGKTFVYAAMALGGYKEPQQLLALAYALSLGAHFDIVVDLSGFNEVVLSYRENIPAGLHPLYPRSWQALAGVLSPEQKAEIGKIAWLRSARARTARWGSVFPCNVSLTCGLAWHVVDHFWSREILLGNEHILIGDQDSAAPTNPVLAGPPMRLQGSGTVLDAIVDNWKQSAMLIQDIGRSRGFLALTFLQPSPYYHHKVLTKAERGVLRPGNWADRYSTQGYPALQNAVRDLQNNGYRATDLTAIFDAYTGTVFVDACCHFRPEGDRILGKAIGRAILDAL